MIITALDIRWNSCPTSVETQISRWREDEEL